MLSADTALAFRHALSPSQGLSGRNELTQWFDRVFEIFLGSKNECTCGALVVLQTGADAGRQIVIRPPDQHIATLLNFLWRDTTSFKSVADHAGAFISFAPIVGSGNLGLGYVWCRNAVESSALNNSLLSIAELAALQINYAKFDHAIKHLAKPIWNSKSTREAAGELAELTLHTLSVDCVVWLADRRESYLSTVATRFRSTNAQGNVAHSQALQPLDMQFGQGLAGCVAQSAQLLIIEDLLDRDVLAARGLKPRHEIPEQRGWRGAAFLPLDIGGSVIGVIGIYASRPRAFGVVDIDILQCLCNRFSAGYLHLERVAYLTEMQRRLEREAPAIEAGWTAIELVHDIAGDLANAGSTLNDKLIKDIASCESKLFGRPMHAPKLESAARNVVTAHRKVRAIGASSKRREMKVSRVAVFAFLNECRQVTETFYTDSRVTVEVVCDERLEAWFDKLALQRVIVNLLNNAFYFLRELKFRANKRVVLKAVMEKQLLVIECWDNGPGIAPENVGEVFEYYYTTKGDRGLGFGLAIAKGIVEQHQGQISAKSLFGSWTSFTIRIPVLPK